VIRDKYTRGEVDIITLIDAQNQSLIQGQRAVIANYQYMNDLINLQRAISWFACTKNQEERDNFSNKFLKLKEEKLNENTKS
jgi:outer membrane protein